MRVQYLTQTRGGVFLKNPHHYYLCRSQPGALVIRDEDERVRVWISGTRRLIRMPLIKLPDTVVDACIGRPIRQVIGTPLFDGHSGGAIISSAKMHTAEDTFWGGWRDIEYVEFRTRTPVASDTDVERCGATKWPVYFDNPIPFRAHSASAAI